MVLRRVVSIALVLAGATAPRLAHAQAVLFVRTQDFVGSPVITAVEPSGRVRWQEPIWGATTLAVAADGPPRRPRAP